MNVELERFYTNTRVRYCARIACLHWDRRLGNCGYKEIAIDENGECVEHELEQTDDTEKAI